MGFITHTRQARQAGQLGSPITEGRTPYGEQLSLKVVDASTDGKYIDNAILPSPTEIYPASCFQNERAIGILFPMEACQGECTYDGNRTDRLVDKSEQIHQTGSKPAKDNSMEPLQSGGRSRAKAKKFLKENGPRMARAAVMTGMFVFNVVSICC